MIKGKHSEITLEYSDGPAVITRVLTSRDPFIAGVREMRHEMNWTHFTSLEGGAREPGAKERGGLSELRMALNLQPARTEGH